MDLIDWNDSLSVGVQQIDQEHKKLIDLINILNESMKNGKSKETLQIVFSELVDYTITHFTNEEMLMQKANYVNFAVHKHEHDQLTQRAKVLRDDYKSGKLMISIEVRDFLKDWIINHIQKTDKLYTKAMNEKGIK